MLFRWCTAHTPIAQTRKEVKEKTGKQKKGKLQSDQLRYQGSMITKYWRFP